MKPRIDVMLDLETLSTKQSANVIQISAVTFDLTNDNFSDIRTFNQCCELSSERTTDQDTLAWWNETNHDLLANLLRDGAGCDQLTAVHNFQHWIFELQNEYNMVYVWGNGSTFDNAKIENMCEQYKLKYPVNYKCNMDLRTLIRVAGITTNLGEDYLKDIAFEGDEHNALDDCKHQIKIAHRCINEMFSVERGW